MVGTPSFEGPTSDVLTQCRAELERLRSALRGDDSPPSERRLARVERALAWLGSGHYGFCGICRGPLDEHSLRAAPDALVCEQCTRRPVAIEQPVVMPAW